MSNRNILFIVEGEADEPVFIKKLFKVCYSKQNYKTYTYKTNLHNLAKRLEEDYPDFDKEEIDIQLILRSFEQCANKKAILNGSYTDIFLIFDFEPQQDYPRFNTIRRMLETFNDSTSLGKLFINYPMMQSYKHFSHLPDDSFCDNKVTIEQCKKYKELVGSISAYTDLNKYDYPLFISLTVHHLRKANYILNDIYTLPVKDEYLEWKQVAFFDKQIDYKNSCDLVYVLNTCIFILVDYNPSSFFRQLTDRKGQFYI